MSRSRRCSGQSCEPSNPADVLADLDAELPSEMRRQLVLGLCGDCRHAAVQHAAAVAGERVCGVDTQTIAGKAHDAGSRCPLSRF